MPVMESYAPGTFCWADLGSPDALDAKRFYTALFGWTAEDRPMGPGERIWLLCAPGDSNGSKPWIAGSTMDGIDNAWVAKAVQLWKRGQPSSFDLLGVLTTVDPNQVDPSKLREWANSYEHTVNRVTLQIGETRASGRR